MCAILALVAYGTWKRDISGRDATAEPRAGAMILVGYAIVAIAMVELFSSQETEPRSEPDREQSTIDRWATEYAMHLGRAIAIVLGPMHIYDAYFYPAAPVAETRAFSNW